MFGKPASRDEMAFDSEELTGLEWLHNSKACISSVRSLEVEGRRAVVLAK